jgi:predicted RNase H-like nuclease (RuvC/YqgF family)
MLKNIDQKLPAVVRDTSNFHKSHSQFMQVTLDVTAITPIRSIKHTLAEIDRTRSALQEAYISTRKKQVDLKRKQKELEEANKAVKAMREELQEVNLLNAKLLYVNKIWKGKSLSESQKVKVLNAFDRATTVKEAENIFKTLNESLVAPKKADLKESMGFASKPIGSAPAKPIVEVDSMVARCRQSQELNN